MNRITGYIFEEYVNPVVGPDGWYIFDWNTMYRIEHYKPVPVLTRENSFHVNFLWGRMWITDYKTGCSFAFDEENSDKKYKQCNILFYHVHEFGDGLILGLDIVSRPQKIFIWNPLTGKIHEMEGEFAEMRTDGELIFVKMEYQSYLRCFDAELKMKWEYAFDEVYSASMACDTTPVVIDDVVVIYHTFDIIAFDKYNGTVIWKHHFPNSFTSYYVKDKKIYLVCEAVFYVFDALTGKQLMRIETGFTHEIRDEDGDREENDIYVYPLDDYLYVQSTHDGYTAIHSKDWTTIIEKLHHAHLQYTRPIQKALPLIKGNTMVTKVVNYRAYSGYGGLEIIGPAGAGDVPGEVHVLPRPEVRIYANPSLHEKHRFDIYLDVDNLTYAIRYGTLNVKELHYATGYLPIFNIKKGPTDRLHNGEINLFLDPEQLGKEAPQKLQSMVDELNELFEDFTAGDRKTTIKVKLSLIPRNEWKESGEKLDWPAMRDWEEPIN